MGRSKRRAGRRAAKAGTACGATSLPSPPGALLFADIADAKGGRIAVFYRDGLAALELYEPQHRNAGRVDLRRHRVILDKDGGRW